jgi:hypothetical protein
MKRLESLTAIAALTLSVVLQGAVRAGDDPWTSVDEAAKKRGWTGVFLVVTAPADGDDVKHLTERLGDKALAKAVKDGLLAVRLEPGDAEAAGKLGIPQTKKEKFFVLDGYGLVVSQHEAVSTASDTLARLVKDAHDATAKKKKIEKALDGAVAKGEAALKKGDPRSACEAFSPVVEYKATIPCPAVATAEKRLEELAEKGADILTKARNAVESSEYPKAQKLLTEATNDYPLPSVLAYAKTVREELAEAMNAESK